MGKSKAVLALAVLISISIVAIDMASNSIMELGIHASPTAQARLDSTYSALFLLAASVVSTISTVGYIAWLSSKTAKRRHLAVPGSLIFGTLICLDILFVAETAGGLYADEHHTSGNIFDAGLMPLISIIALLLVMIAYNMAVQARRKKLKQLANI